MCQTYGPFIILNAMLSNSMHVYMERLEEQAQDYPERPDLVKISASLYLNCNMPHWAGYGFNYRAPLRTT